MACTRKLTKQIVFDRVIKHLVKQGVPARDTEENACSYRTTVNGKVLKCAVGCLISDKNYSPKLENKTAKDSNVLMAVRRTARRPLEDGVKELLGALQELHDLRQFEDGFLLPSTKRSFIEEATEVARCYDLNTKVLEGI